MTALPKNLPELHFNCLRKVECSGCVSGIDSDSLWQAEEAELGEESHLLKVRKYKVAEMKFEIRTVGP